MLAVADIGKTHARLLVIDEGGVHRAARRYQNRAREVAGRRVLDAEGIESWLFASLRELSMAFAINAVVPVAHGAAAALVGDNDLAAPVLDYESDPPPGITRSYEQLREPFGRTFSPRLPHGLNLGVQLFWQEHLYPDVWPANAQALLWPQYWAWRLCGERAGEVTSLGCHTDLWCAAERDWSSLARTRGWDTRMGPLKRAGDSLGTIRTSATGLPRTCEVLVGLHDSNAALWGTRAFPEIEGRPFTVLSTGTWFVAMQSGAKSMPALDEARDTLANVDVAGQTVPSSRFMGGREYELIVEASFDAAATPADALRLIERDVMTRPSFVSGCGPFPNSQGAILGRVQHQGERAALAAIHLALMSDQSLACIDAQGPIVIEGRFANNEIFVRSLAALRSDRAVYCSAVEDAIALGAARLKHPGIRPAKPLQRVEPLAADLSRYRTRWLEHAHASKH